MKYFINFIVVISIMAMCKPTLGQVLPKNDPDWQLVFEDEFDSLGLNTYKWNMRDWRCSLYSSYDDLDSCIINRTHRTNDNSYLIFDTTGTGKIIIRAIKPDTPIVVWSGNYCVSLLCMG
jgi:hypothetical protein